MRTILVETEHGHAIQSTTTTDPEVFARYVDALASGFALRAVWRCFVWPEGTSARVAHSGTERCMK